MFTYIFAMLISVVYNSFFSTDGQFFESKAFQVAEFLVFIPIFVYLKIRHYPFSATLRWRAIPLNVVGISLVIGLSITLLITELDYLISLVFPVPEILMKTIENLMRVNSTSELLLVFTSTVLVAGIFEEMLFRGFFQQAFENSQMDLTYSIFLTALVFSLFHIPWWYLQTTIFGIILGVMAWKSNSILPGAIVHAVNNALNILFINVDSSHYRWLEWKGHISPWILVVAAVAIYWGFQKLYQHYDRAKKQPENLKIPEDNSFKDHAE
jgi:membrane protease YdiL (CAAX protease family)